MDSIDYLRELAAVAPQGGSASPNARKAAGRIAERFFARALAADPASQAIDRGYPAVEELFA